MYSSNLPASEMDPEDWEIIREGKTMADVLVRLEGFMDQEAAELTAENIRQSGGIKYTDNSGSEVNVTVGTVTVESSSLP